VLLSKKRKEKMKQEEDILRISFLMLAVGMVV